MLCCYQVLLEDLSDFDLDRTGRITIWPSSQILTYWCLKNINYFDGKSVIELGCGFHALPGLAIAKFSGGCLFKSLTFTKYYILWIRF